MWSIYEIIHIWTAVVDESEEWSSQLKLERRSQKKSGLQRDSNPWPPRFRCDALPTKLWSHTLGARSIYWVHIFPCSEMMWSICEIIHWTVVVDESEEWSSQLNFNLRNWKEEAWKNQGFIPLKPKRYYFIEDPWWLAWTSVFSYLHSVVHNFCVVRRTLH